jgi:hypothetical protein
MEKYIKFFILFDIINIFFFYRYYYICENGIKTLGNSISSLDHLKSLSIDL